VPFGVGKDSAKKSYGSARCSPAAPDIRQAALLPGLAATSRFATGHVMQEAIDVFARDGGDLDLAKKRFDVTLYASTISS
jgi:hypothetical protein